ERLGTLLHVQGTVDGHLAGCGHQSGRVWLQHAGRCPAGSARSALAGRAPGAEVSDAAIRTETLAPGGTHAVANLSYVVRPDPLHPGRRGGPDVRGESLRQGPRRPARQAWPGSATVPAVFLLDRTGGAGEPRGVAVDETAGARGDKASAPGHL